MLNTRTRLLLACLKCSSGCLLRLTKKSTQAPQDCFLGRGSAASWGGGGPGPLGRFYTDTRGSPRCSQHALLVYRSALLKHVKSKHRNLRVPCDQCSYQAKDRSALKKHTNSKHEKTWISCPSCDFKGMISRCGALLLLCLLLLV